MEQVAEGLLPAARVAVVLAFVVLALLASVRARGGGSTGRWAAAAFGTMAVALLGGWLPDLADIDLPRWLDDARTVLILAFPYLLLRFTASFVSLARWLEGAAAAAAAAVVAVTLVLSPATDDDATNGWYLLGVLAYWVLVSLVTIVRLWQAGRDQPTVTRRRMRLMSAGTAVLAIALLLAGRLADTSPLAALGVDAFALLSAAAFGIGFSPPRALRLSWRRAEEEQLQAATVAVLRARTATEVADELLPPTARMVNGGGAVVVDPSARVVASFGDAPPVGTELPPGNGEVAGRRIQVALGGDRGEVIVWTGPYTRFFGRDDSDLLKSMAAVADLALERCELLAEERGQTIALQRAQEEAERARAEAIRANTAKSAFLSRMSHELRTPLNAILGFGQLLETSTLEEVDQEGVGHILKAGRHLLALINDILDLSRIEAGAMTISLEPVHANELIEDTLALIRPLAVSRSIELRVDDVRCDAYVLTDRQRGRQVLLNLLSNAVKYNHDRGWVEVSCDADTDSQLRISVRDSGPGIDPSRQQQLFEPFERLGAETSGVEGTGLGLALTKQLIERMGGSVGVDSTPGSGSTFWVDLLLTDHPGEHDEPAAPEHAPASTGQHTLLLVEDNLANLRVVEAMLRRRPGISVIPAMQGQLALDLAHELRPDVIVLDLHLPDLTGREVLHRLQSDPSTRDTPVIIASADAVPSRVRELLEVGAFAYITKPLDLQHFLDVVDRAIASPRTSPDG